MSAISLKFSAYLCAAAMISGGGAVAQASSDPRIDDLEQRALEAYDQGDSALAGALWLEAAELGAPDAMTAYGGLLAEGDGAPLDPQAALRWYEAAAQAGEPHAMTLVAETLLEDAPESGAARDLFARAAALGHPRAIRRLSELGGAADDKKLGSKGEPE